MTKTKFDAATLNVPGKLIIWFDDFNGDEGQPPSNRYRFLSNFYEGAPFALPGLNWEDEGPVMFATGEHAFQAMKTTDDMNFTAIVGAATPGLAKKLGRTCELRPDWERIKLDVMAAVVRSKFTPEREEGQWLLDTEDAMLIEGTYWGDTVWGVDLKSPNAPGRNWLGTLLMARRAELKAQKHIFHPTVEANMSWLLGE